MVVVRGLRYPVRHRQLARHWPKLMERDRCAEVTEPVADLGVCRRPLEKLDCRNGIDWVKMSSSARPKARARHQNHKN